MLVYFARSGARHPLLPVALGLLIGGSVSNLVDRLRLGHVTDFLDLALLAGLQPRGHLHRRRCGDPARRRSSPPSASRACSTPRRTRRDPWLSVTLAVPPEAAGERLDRFLAALDGVGSRAAAERLRRRRAASSSTARRVPKSHRLAGGEEVAFEVARARGVDARAGAARARASPTRTSTCSSSTSPRASSCTRRAGHRDRHARPRPARPGSRAARSPSGRGSSTGSTATRPGCSWSRARTTRTGGSRSSLRRRELEREYLALVRGRPRSRRGRIEAPIGRDRARSDAHVARHGDAAGRRDALRGRGARCATHALLRVRLETGRTHQIRVHLAAIDLPVVGDPAYGVAGDLGLERQFLHAARLAFDHPLTGEPGRGRARRCRRISKRRSAGGPGGRLSS